VVQTSLKVLAGMIKSLTSINAAAEEASNTPGSPDSAPKKHFTTSLP
jgi:hypothetical protein